MVPDQLRQAKLIGQLVLVANTPSAPAPGRRIPTLLRKISGASTRDNGVLLWEQQGATRTNLKKHRGGDIYEKM